ncbi:MAG: hypothetical protein WCF13_06955 [Stellaceae bacterium]
MSAEIIDLAARRPRPQESDEPDIIARRIGETLYYALQAIRRGEYEKGVAAIENAHRDVLRACEAPSLIAGMGGSETERQYVRRCLAGATDKLRADDLAMAQWMIGNAAKAIAQVIAGGRSEDDERREIPKRRRRLEAAKKASETRRRNRAFRQTVR